MNHVQLPSDFVIFSRIIYYGNTHRESAKRENEEVFAEDLSTRTPVALTRYWYI